MKKKARRNKADFPNDWLLYKKLKPKHFCTASFKEFWEERVLYWELLPGIQMVARSEHLTSGRIKEHTFHSVSQVNRFFKKIMKSGEPYHIHCFDSHQTFTAVFGTDD